MRLSRASPRLRRAYDLISDKLARVEEELLLHFQSPIPTIDRIGSYLADGGGKRIRPALLLLSARLLDYEDGEKDVRYAAVVEFIHTATLVHDDIIDGRACAAAAPPPTPAGETTSRCCSATTSTRSPWASRSTKET
jgi:Geranylgeranyl pyrophosphate synthase